MMNMRDLPKLRSAWKLRPGRVKVVIAFIGLCGLIALAPCASSGQAGSSANSGPVRLARISFVSGDVSLRTSDQGQWSTAVRNLPIRQGSTLSAEQDGRAEIQFDDGSKLRFGGGTVVTLTQLYSDSQGEYTQVTMRSGYANLRVTKAPSVYQIDAPFASIDASGPARVRIDATNGLRTCVYQGSAVVQGGKGKITLNADTSVRLASASDALVAQPLPAQDDFDRWVVSMDAGTDTYEHSSHRAYVPSNVAIVGENLDDYGDWRDDAHYGHVWCPRSTDASWRPYHNGHWVWVDPFGWTWVADEPWGWAPYHYGTWVHESYGWGWVPGTRAQYWSPAVVDFYQTGGDIAWCPLAPTEVVYPASISIGFRSGNWSLFFGIGGAAMYYPNSAGICNPSPWNSGYINRAAVVVNFGSINNYYGGHGGGAGWNHNSFVPGAGFVPYNARRAAGASIAQVAAFGGRGEYRALPAGAASSFRGGHFVGAPAKGGRPMAGPPAARPTVMSASVSRSFHAAPPAAHAALTRAIYHPAASAAGAAGVRHSLAQRPPAAQIGAPRNAVVGVRPTGAKPGSFAHSGAPGSKPAIRMPAVTPAQNAANQARSALGKPHGAMLPRGGKPGSGPANAPQHQAAVQHNMAAQHHQAAVQHNAAVQHHQAAVQHNAAVQHHQAAVQHNAVVQHHQAAVQHNAAVQHHQAAVQHNAVVQHHQAAVQHNAAVQHHQAAVQHNAVVQQHHQAPQRQAPQHQAQRQAPQHQAQRQAPQHQAQRQAPQHQAQRQAPQRQAPPNRAGGDKKKG